MIGSAAPDPLNRSNPAPRLRTRSGEGLGSIGLGTMGLGGFFQRDEENDADARAALETAAESGIRLFDTAEVYGGGHSEELIGEVLSSGRDEVFISTKVSPEHLRPEVLRTAAYESLERLQTDFIDLYYIHWPNPAVPIDETMSAMAALVDEGIIRYLGLSNFMAAEAAEAEAASPRHPIAAVQAEYNLFDRTHDDNLFPYCRDRETCFVAYSPLDVGRLLSATPDAAVARLAAEFGLSAAQLMLKWVVRNDGIIAIPKSMTPDHIRQNAAISTLSVADEGFAKLSNLISPKLLNVDPTRIRTDDKGLAAFVPGPNVLASTLRDGVRLKPVRLVANDTSEAYDYNLVEGKLRYWAWVKAFPDGRPIPALIRN